jgi:hypothetical protein
MMKLLKISLVTLLFLVNSLAVQPSWADPPKFTENTDYIEVSTTLDKLLKARDIQTSSEGRTAQEVKQKIANLQFQKYILETTNDWGICRNETGKTLAIYAHKPKKDFSFQENTLYFLADGQETEDDWDCDGVYLPSETKVVDLHIQQSNSVQPISSQEKSELSYRSAPKQEPVIKSSPKPQNSNSFFEDYKFFDDLISKTQSQKEPKRVLSSTAKRKQAKTAPSSSQFKQVQELKQPIALKIVDGTQLVATTNPQGVIEFNVPPAKIWQAGEANWSIPNLTQADIDLKVPNAPIDD